MFGGITRMRSVNPAEVSRAMGSVCSATLLTAGRRAATVHTPSTDIQFFAVAVIQAAFEILVVRDIVNCVGVVFGPPTAMTA